ncbi:MAG: DNA polymerase III subunit delta [Oscillospiraceae bacterium]|nr:DNA polymerase III subunit delta [Oscillospiraceae bacterium]
MDAAEFRALVKSNKLRGGYLFYGDEEYMKQYCLSAVYKALIPDESLDVFNYIKFDSDNYSASVLSNSIISLPMLNKFKLIELRGLDIGGMNETEFEDFCSVLADQYNYDYNIIIVYMQADSFNAGTAKSPSKLLTTLSKYLIPVVFEYETPAKLIKWIQQHFAAENIFCDTDMCEELIRTAGRAMVRLNSEIEKLCAYILFHGRDKVQQHDIANVTAYTKTIDPFDFANAILEGNTDAAFYILTDMKQKKEKHEIILGSISRVYDELYVIKTMADNGLTQQTISAQTKIHEYKVGIYLRCAAKYDVEVFEKAVELCHEADIKIKSTTLESYMVLDRLVVELSMLRVG